LKLLIGIIVFLFVVYTQAFPQSFQEIQYVSQGSCEQNNLLFNAARFTKIDLNKKSEHDLPMFLQVILFLSDDGQVRIRTQEMGLVQCQTHPTQGETCSYRPYPETKKLLTSSWTHSNDQTNDLTNDQIQIDHLGSIRRIRPDQPWIGFELTLSDVLSYPQLQEFKVIGGQVLVNFNRDDQNVARLCKPK